MRSRDFYGSGWMKVGNSAVEIEPIGFLWRGRKSGVWPTHVIGLVPDAGTERTWKLLSLMTIGASEDERQFGVF